MNGAGHVSALVLDKLTSILPKLLSLPYSIALCRLKYVGYVGVAFRFFASLLCALTGQF